MEYKLTFEDGSEALMHHGIKGMKWGVWNAETAARYKGHRKTPAERGYAPSKKQAEKANLRFDTAEANLKTAEKEYVSNKNENSAKNLAKAQKKYASESKHKDYVLSGKQAQRRGRALKTAAVLGYASAVLSGVGAVGTLGTAMSNLGYASQMLYSKPGWADVAITLATGQIKMAHVWSGKAVVNAVIGNSASSIAKLQKRNR